MTKALDDKIAEARLDLAHAQMRAEQAEKWLVYLLRQKTDRPEGTGPAAGATGGEIESPTAQETKG